MLFRSTIIGFIFLIIPGIILGILWLMLPFVVLFEKKRFWQIFGSSAKLVWGDWWFVSITYGLMAFVLGGVNIIASFLPSSWAILSALIITVWSVFTMSLMTALHVNLYSELLVRKAK